MNTKTRLAAREFPENRNISTSRRVRFPGSTLHGHDFYELDIIVSGEAETVINGDRHVMKSGDVCFMTPADFHEYSFKEPFDLYNVQFTEDAISEKISTEIPEISSRFFTPSEKDREKIFTLVELMKSTATEDKKSADILTRLLECIILTIIQNPKSDSSLGKKYSSAMQRTLTYVNSHFKENPPLSEIAALASLDERYFCSKFKEYTGKTYKEYLREIKLKYSKRLILASELSIIEISERSGYATQSHFNREFKDFYGISPLGMRKSKKHE